MKCSVSKEWKAAAIAAPIIYAIGWVMQADETGFIFLTLGAMLVYALIEAPPPWLLRSPLGRWLRR